jgi:hypothetical protein
VRERRTFKATRFQTNSFAAFLYYCSNAFTQETLLHIPHQGHGGEGCSMIEDAGLYFLKKAWQEYFE